MASVDFAYFTDADMPQANTRLTHLFKSKTNQPFFFFLNSLFPLLLTSVGFCFCFFAVLFSSTGTPAFLPLYVWMYVCIYMCIYFTNISRVCLCVMIVYREASVLLSQLQVAAGFRFALIVWNPPPPLVLKLHVLLSLLCVHQLQPQSFIHFHTTINFTPWKSYFTKCWVSRRSVFLSVLL